MIAYKVNNVSIDHISIMATVWNNYPLMKLKTTYTAIAYNDIRGIWKANAAIAVTSKVDFLPKWKTLIRRQCMTVVVSILL